MLRERNVFEEFLLGALKAVTLVGNGYKRHVGKGVNNGDTYLRQYAAMLLP